MTIPPPPDIEPFEAQPEVPQGRGCYGAAIIIIAALLAVAFICFGASLR